MSTDSSWLQQCLPSLSSEENSLQVVGSRLDDKSPTNDIGWQDGGAILHIVGWSRGNITSHDAPVDEGLYGGLTDEIKGDLTSQL